MATQAERRATTRASIVRAASELFASYGYDGTTVDAVLDRAGVSRGALYHHFASKEDVLAAVFVATSTDAIRRAGVGIDPDSGPLDALVDGCLAWLDVVAEPSVAQILLADGPAVLGVERASALEAATSLGVMRRLVDAAAAADEVEVAAIDLTAHMINAAVAAAAIAVRDGRASRVQARDATAAMIRGLS